MSELNPRELPHEFLLRKYGLQVGQLSSHTQQLKKDLDKTLRLVLNKSQSGSVTITPATQSKIETYDRYICDGIFEYLENNEVITEGQAQSEKKSAEQKREEVSDKMEEASNSNPNPNPNPSGDEPQKESGGRIGFWDWK